MIETVPLEQAADGYYRADVHFRFSAFPLFTFQAHFRMVLVAKETALPARRSAEAKKNLLVRRGPRTFQYRITPTTGRQFSLS